MNFRERLESLGQVALVVFLLAATAFLSAITAMRFAIQGREVEVPNVLGTKAGDAEAVLAGRQLGMRIADRIYSDLPVDYVVRQSPPAGMRVKIQQRVHVVLSLGLHRVAIPALLGKSLRAARIELLRSALQVGELSNTYLGDYRTDSVVQQNPPSGATDAVRPRVDLLISLGARQPAYLMPDLLGLTQTEAQRRIFAAGLRLGKITFLPNPAAPHGSVAGQTPRPGRAFPLAGS